MTAHDTATVYHLRDPRDGETRYVGVTVRPLRARLANHVSGARVSEKKCGAWIRDLQSEGLRPEIEALEVVDLVDAGAAEVRWIAFFRENGINLINKTSGGDVHTLSPEWRARMSELRAGRMPSDTARQHLRESWTPARRAATAAQASQQWTGKPKSAETRAKMSAAWTPEMRAAQAERARINNKRRAAHAG